MAFAFVDDPLMRWIIPSTIARQRGLPRLFAAMMRHHYLAGGGVEVASIADDIVGVALWAPPGRWHESPLQSLAMMPHILWALRFRMRVMQQILKENERFHPSEPHWYLGVIGTDPRARGVGVGSAMMRSRLSFCDAENVPAYLETTNPENIPFYERFGFEVQRPYCAPNGGPPLAGMWRPAHTD